MDFRARIRSVTSETSEDLLECMARKEKKSLTLQTSEGMRSPACSEPSSPTTRSRRVNLVSVFSSYVKAINAAIKDPLFGGNDVRAMR
jgi:hypothetical protein